MKTGNLVMQILYDDSQGESQHCRYGLVLNPQADIGMVKCVEVLWTPDGEYHKKGGLYREATRIAYLMELGSSK